jgi:hypothetical protein
MLILNNIYKLIDILKQAIILYYFFTYIYTNNIIEYNNNYNQKFLYPKLALFLTNQKFL